MTPSSRVRSPGEEGPLQAWWGEGLGLRRRPAGTSAWGGGGRGGVFGAAPGLASPARLTGQRGLLGLHGRCAQWETQGRHRGVSVRSALPLLAPDAPVDRGARRCAPGQRAGSGAGAPPGVVEGACAAVGTAGED